MRETLLQAMEDIADDKLLIAVVLLMRDPIMAARLARYIEASPDLQRALDRAVAPVRRAGPPMPSNDNAP